MCDPPASWHRSRPRIEKTTCSRRPTAAPARLPQHLSIDFRARRRALESQEPDSTTRHALSDADFVSRESNERKKTSHAPQFAHSDGCLPNRTPSAYVPATHGRTTSVTRPDPTGAASGGRARALGRDAMRPPRAACPGGAGACADDDDGSG